MVVCGAVKHAVKAEQAGCDAVICQGGEGGGHTGLVGTLPFVAQAVDAVKIPVAAAGGLYDGSRHSGAALALGAQGGLAWARASSPLPRRTPAISIARPSSTPPTKTRCARAAIRANPCA